MSFRQKNVYVAVLNQGELRTELTKIVSMMIQQDGYRINITYPHKKPIANNRNNIVQRFLARKEFDYLMMIDSDIIPPPNIMKLVDFDKDIIVPLMFVMQNGKVLPLYLKKAKDGQLEFHREYLEKQGLIPVDATGTGCIIIARRVLEKIKHPFRNEYDSDGIKTLGLDLNFCLRAKKLGFQSWVHLDYVADHHSVASLREIYYMLLQKEKVEEEYRKLYQYLLKTNKDVLNKYEHGGNVRRIIEKDGRKYIMMDKHKFAMPVDGEVGINSVMSVYRRLRNVWKPNTTKLIKKRIKEGMTVIDIGASVGYFTQLLARQVGKTGRVLSIEPTPNQFPYLQENIRINGYSDRVKAFNVAAWDKNEMVKMPPTDKKFDCQAITIDELLEKEGIEKVDFIKIDVDGSEPHTLKGLEKTFEKNPDLQIMFEYYPRCIRENGGNPEEVKATIEKHFTYDVIPDDVPIEDGANWWCKRK